MRKAGCPGGARILGCALGMSLGVGCSGDRVLIPGAESSSGEPSTSTTTSTTTSGGSSSTSLAGSSSTGLADDTTGTASTDEPEVIFLPELDVGGQGSFECDLFAQDCPPDQKCMPWAPDGGSTWHGWGCKPLADDPVGIDEVCHVQGSYTAGIDDCELGAMCWDVDPKTNQGTCISFCVNSEQDPICEDPERQCQTGSDNTLWLCVPVCDPIAQDCPVDQACYFFSSLWQCAPDASGDAGAYGDGCDVINLCDPGLVCLEASAVAGCEGTSGCCTDICDITDPLGDMQCAGVRDGAICQPWYEDGTAPPGSEHVGVCVLPQ